MRKRYTGAGCEIFRKRESEAFATLHSVYRGEKPIVCTLRFDYMQENDCQRKLNRKL